MGAKRKHVQLPLFTVIKTERSTVSLRQRPFPHIEVRSANGKLMLPVEELLKAKKLIDGLSRSEKRAVKELLALAKVSAQR